MVNIFLGIGGGEANSSADMFVAQEHDNLQRDFEQKTWSSNCLYVA